MNQIEVRVYDGHVNTRDYSRFYSNLKKAPKEIIETLLRAKDYEIHNYDVRGDNGGDCVEIDGCDLSKDETLRCLEENLRTSSSIIEVCCRRKAA
ncbi:hypothetical protein K9L16_03500 [Candidatus Pacearchaeota archaeon]|nr:hypothetical protein [Candidatus Pacearchaeota archaeon]